MTKDITRYKVKNDIIFKYIFSNEDILKSFLEAILDEKVDTVEVQNDYPLTKENIRDKLGVLDIKATINGESLVNVEMQNKLHKSYVQRIYLYFGGIIRGQIKKGDTYDKIKDVIIINILNECKFKDINQVHTIWRLREDKNLEYGALNGMQIHFIELDKFRKQKNPNFDNKLNQWLAFVDTENKEWVESVMEKNKKIEEASKLKENFTADDDSRELLELYEKWEMDEITFIHGAREESIKQGLKSGIESVVISMLKNNFEIEQISVVTKLSI